MMMRLALPTRTWFRDGPRDRFSYIFAHLQMSGILDVMTSARPQRQPMRPMQLENHQLHAKIIATTNKISRDRRDGKVHPTSDASLAFLGSIANNACIGSSSLDPLQWKERMHPAELVSTKSSPGEPCKVDPSTLTSLHTAAEGLRTSV